MTPISSSPPPSLATYRIDNTHTSVHLATVCAASEQEALDIMARDFGYESYADLQRQVPAVSGGIIVTDVSSQWWGVVAEDQDERPWGPILGIGHSSEDAWADAEREAGGESLDGCCAYPLTPALAAEVDEYGGDVAYREWGTTLCTSDEWNARAVVRA